MKRVLRGLWLWFQVALAVAIVAELGIRWIESRQDEFEVGALTSHLVFRDDYFVIRPGLRLIQPERFGNTRYSFNADGFRDRDHIAAGEALRVLFLGDSVTFGLGSDDGRVFPRLVEADWNAVHGPHAQLGAVNLGIFNYAGPEQAAVLEQIGLGLDPDLIVLQLYLNDFYLDPGSTRPEGEGAGEAGGRDSAWARFEAASVVLRNQSAFYRRLRQLVQGINYRLFHDLRRTRFPETLNASELERKVALFEAHPDDASYPSFRHLRGMQRMARQHGIPFLVVLTPNEVQLYDHGFDSINERIRRFCQREGIPFHDLLPAMRETPERALFNDGVHLSDHGHRFMADFLAPLVRAQIGYAGPGGAR